ncbi:predicted protein [Uncinocarpus reesii 1704]|uniref:Nucleolar protein Dnt1-like N-terminal domain-containing protein n=1 Tax=Uncinocarpus reesii (strain UAMH 1704) TaxID=336963 RepID=C4JUB9_UNCRE|nr:uncharacterized protein UREG_06058 [Uncinocarpus reesii 1704]EEP81216.1 predicted protein [Uncinocarpus reesii 1704]
MVLLRLNIKILPVPLLPGDCNLPHTRATVFMIPITKPEGLSMRELACQIREKWAKLRSEAGPLHIKKLLDDNNPSVDVDMDLSVADVFVDTGKARADGLDQRGTVRVIQIPSLLYTRLESIAQDWNDPMGCKQVATANTAPPVPLFHETAPNNPNLDPPAQNLEYRDPDTLRVSIETDEPGNVHDEDDILDITSRPAECHGGSPAVLDQTSSPNRPPPNKQIPRFPRVVVEIRNSNPSRSKLSENTQKDSSPEVHPVEASQFPPRGKRPGLSFADSRIVDRARFQIVNTKRQRRQTVKEGAAPPNELYSNTENELPLDRQQEARKKGRMKEKSDKSDSHRQPEASGEAQTDDDVTVIDPPPTRAEYTSLPKRAANSKKQRASSTTGQNGTSAQSKVEVIDLTQVRSQLTQDFSLAPSLEHPRITGTGAVISPTQDSESGGSARKATDDTQTLLPFRETPCFDFHSTSEASEGSGDNGNKSSPPKEDFSKPKTLQRRNRLPAPQPDSNTAKKPDCAKNVLCPQSPTSAQKSNSTQKRDEWVPSDWSVDPDDVAFPKRQLRKPRMQNRPEHEVEQQEFPSPARRIRHLEEKETFAGAAHLRTVVEQPQGYLNRALERQSKAPQRFQLGIQRPERCNAQKQSRPNGQPEEQPRQPENPENRA